ncbi:MAG: aminoglycoside phosphotransferase family protein [Anaerocolumna sp.]|nr:aminoglycoside phosphotransferase family protein [Anaerocolumna sp.]
MGDFKEDNVLFSNDNGEWKVSAIFDFSLSHFGDGEEDLSRICAMYINESNDTNLAREFINHYVKLSVPREGFIERSKLYTIRERLDIWSWAKNQNQVWCNKNMTLREWLELYLSIEI